MIWVQFRKSKNSELDLEGLPAIFVPIQFAELFPPAVHLKFGKKELEVYVKTSSALSSNGGDDFKSPMPIECSAKMMDELLIPTKIPFQMYLTNKNLHVGPVIGLLLGEQHYYYHDRFMQDLKDAMGVYEKTGGLFIAFKECSIAAEEQSIYGLCFNYRSQKWEYGKFPLPSVIYRRRFNSSTDLIQQLSQTIDWKIFNEVRLDKWQLYNLFKENKSLEPYLPETELLSFETLQGFLAKYSSVILKPADLSRGRGITVISQTDKETVKVFDYRLKKGRLLKKSHLENFLIFGHYLKRNYIIQPYIKLSRIHMAPWDIRIVMQKNERQKWECSGIECRLAAIGSLVTNISNGGKALSLAKAVKLASGGNVDSAKIQKDIEAISMKICETLDQTGYLFAELGLDMAIDNSLNYWIIEANVRPTFNGFKAFDYESYRKICCKPMLYSTSLAGFDIMDSK